MRYIFLLSAAALLTGCTTVTPVSGPDGRQAFSIQCGNDRTRCLKKAGDLCPTGYRVVDNSSTMIGAPVNGSFMMTNKEVVTVSCK